MIHRIRVQRWSFHVPLETQQSCFKRREFYFWMAYFSEVAAGINRYKYHRSYHGVFLSDASLPSWPTPRSRRTEGKKDANAWSCLAQSCLDYYFAFMCITSSLSSLVYIQPMCLLSAFAFASSILSFCCLCWVDRWGGAAYVTFRSIYSSLPFSIWRLLSTLAAYANKSCICTQE